MVNVQATHGTNTTRSFLCLVRSQVSYPSIDTKRPSLVSAPRLMRREIRIGGSTTSSSTTLRCLVNRHKYETLREQTSI